LNGEILAAAHGRPLARGVVFEKIELGQALPEEGVVVHMGGYSCVPTRNGLTMLWFQRVSCDAR